MLRLSYRYKGIDLNRFGGAWWHHDFINTQWHSARQQLNEFRAALEPHCEEMIVSEVSIFDLINEENE